MVNEHDELEWETRKERIDKALARHWNIVKHTGEATELNSEDNLYRKRGGAT